MDESRLMNQLNGQVGTGDASKIDFLKALSTTKQVLWGL